MHMGKRSAGWYIGSEAVMMDSIVCCLDSSDLLAKLIFEFLLVDD